MKFWHEVDGLLLREAAKHADAIRDALIKTVPVDDIVNRWVDSRVPGETVTTLEARDWANNHFKLPERPLKDALDHVYATGWVMGDDVALAAYANARYNLKKAAPSGEQMSAAISTNWDNWKPGNRPAAALVRPPGGLKKLLDKADATVADANRTTLNRIGTLLADSVGSGKGYDSLARALLRDDITGSVIKDASRAQMIAVTEISRALNTSTVNNYNDFGVEKVEWLAIDTGVCEICPANEAQGPIKLGDVFDSGDEAPPAHPNCRCTILPVVDEGAAANLPTEDEPDLSTPEMEISDVADHGIEDVMAAPAEFKPLDWSDFPSISNATDAEEWALSNYSGEWHKPINAQMRGYDIADSKSRYHVAGEEGRALVSSSINNLKSLISRQTLKENAQVQRYTDPTELGLKNADVKPENVDAAIQQILGSVVESKSFLSTSAMGKSDPVFTDRPIRLLLNLPAGTRAIKNTVSRYYKEQEVLIDSGSKYIITNAYYDKNYGHLVVEALLGEQE